MAAAVSMLLLASLALAGCKADTAPLQAENETLRKQAAKQEQMILSLQEAGKALQQQIDLLNRELRDAQQHSQRAETDRQTLAAKVHAQALTVAEKGGVSEELPQPLLKVTKAVEEALTRNGYAVRVSFRTDERAVYLTDRKSMAPAGLEQTGFRNQYLITLERTTVPRTRLTVRAEFEKLAQGNRVLGAGVDEIAEIERRLVSEIAKRLAAGKTS